jgi:hypothetical protein
MLFMTMEEAKGCNIPSISAIELNFHTNSYANRPDSFTNTECNFFGEFKDVSFICFDFCCCSGIDNNPC